MNGGERAPDRLERQRLRREDLADPVAGEEAELRQRRRVERPRDDAADAEPGQPLAHDPAALSVKVTARISDGSKAPVSTWFAIRRVIVVVLPEPAPARMQTGPRTASTAARCCGFSPSKTSIATQASLGPASAGL